MLVGEDNTTKSNTNEEVNTTVANFDVEEATENIAIEDANQVQPEEINRQQLQNSKRPSQRRSPFRLGKTMSGPNRIDAVGDDNFKHVSGKSVNAAAAGRQPAVGRHRLEKRGSKNAVVANKNPQDKIEKSANEQRKSSKDSTANANPKVAGLKKAAVTKTISDNDLKAKLDRIKANIEEVSNNEDINMSNENQEKMAYHEESDISSQQDTGETLDDNMHVNIDENAGIKSSRKSSNQSSIEIESIVMEHVDNYVNANETKSDEHPSTDNSNDEPKALISKNCSNDFENYDVASNDNHANENDHDINEAKPNKEVNKEDNTNISAAKKTSVNKKSTKKISATDKQTDNALATDNENQSERTADIEKVSMTSVESLDNDTATNYNKAKLIFVIILSSKILRFYCLNK